jgi:hypothetical protein
MDWQCCAEDERGSWCAIEGASVDVIPCIMAKLAVSILRGVRYSHIVSVLDTLPLKISSAHRC